MAVYSAGSTTAGEGYATGSVISRDGTTIGYRQVGQGPGVVLLHGAMSSAHNHMQLAGLLADRFSVTVPDRRARGLSGPYPTDYSIQQEVEDLEAVLAHTGARNVFGVSSGGIISLEAARVLAGIDKAAIYEPPLFVSEPAPTDLLPRLERELDQGRMAAALVTGMKGAQLGPAFFNAMPRPLLELMTTMMMKSEDRKGSGGYVPMRELAPTLRYDFELVIGMSGEPERFKEVRSEVLLLGGGKSPAYLKQALDALEKVLPNASRIEFPALDHAASWNADRGGHPEPVAEALRQFFG